MKRAKIAKRPYTYKGKTEDRWVVLWSDLKGTRREKWFQNKRHAEASATKIDREVADNIHVADRGTVTLKRAAEEYLKWIDQRHQSRNRDIAGVTRYGYQLRIRNHVIPALGHLKLNKLRSIDAQRFIDEKAKKYSRRTATSLLVHLVEILNYAVKNEWLVRNPLKDLPVKVPGKDTRRTDVPGFEEVRQLFVYLLGPRPHAFNRHAWENYRVMVSLAAFAGLRSGECAGLKWEHINWASNEILVQASRSWFDGDKEPKSAAGHRPIPMNPILRRVLEDQHAYWHWRKEGHVLRGRFGGPVGTHSIVTGFRRVMAGAGLTRKGGKHGTQSVFTFHALRHFAVSSWLFSDMRIQDVQRHIGHASINTTMNVYAHILKGDDHSRIAISKTASMFPDMPRAAAVPILQIEGRAEPAMIELRPEGHPDAARATDRIITPEELMKVEETVVTDDGETMTLVAPENAPPWVSVMLTLLRGGWHFQDACDHVRRHRRSVLMTLKRHGLPAPSDIVRAVRNARFTALMEAGYSDAEIAAKCGCLPHAVWDWRVLREGRGKKVPYKSLKEKAFHGYHVNIKTGKTRGNQLKLL